MKKYFFSLISLLVFDLVYGDSISAVSPNQCAKLINTTVPFILVIKKDESLVDNILNCVTNANLNSVSLSGLGAVQNPKLGYYNLSTKKYRYKSFRGIYELTSLNGNITFQNSKPFAHIHVNLSDSNYRTIAGHLDSAQVGATAEITITPLAHSIKRIPDEETGLHLISTPGKS